MVLGVGGLPPRKNEAALGTEEEVGEDPRNISGEVGGYAAYDRGAKTSRGPDLVLTSWNVDDSDWSTLDPFCSLAK